MSDSALHIHAGMLILVVVRVATRYPLSHPLPFSVVAMIAFVNELLNRLAWGSWRTPDTLIDFSYTIFWPAVLFGALWLKQRALSRDDIPSSPVIR